MMQCVRIHIYIGIVQLACLCLYWNTSELFCGFVALKIMPRTSFIVFLVLFSVVDSEKTDPAKTGKLHMIAFLLQHINDVSLHLFQP